MLILSNFHIEKKRYTTINSISRNLGIIFLLPALKCTIVSTKIQFDKVETHCFCRVLSFCFIIVFIRDLFVSRDDPLMS